MSAPSKRAMAPGAPLDIGGIDRQHRIRGFDVGQQTEAQRTRVDEIRGLRAKLPAQPRDHLNAGAVIAQQHIAKPQHQAERRPALAPMRNVPS